MFSLRLLNISGSVDLKGTVLFIEREEQEPLIQVCRRGAHFEATDDVRNTALSCSCASVRCHSCSPRRPNRPTRRPRAEPNCNRNQYSNRHQFNKSAKKDNVLASN